MARLSEADLKRIIKGGETSTVELKLAAPRAVDLAERFCGMANAKGGLVIIGVEDSTHKIVGVADERMGETIDIILRAARQVIKPELVLDPPEPEVYVLADKKLVVATIPPTIGPVYQSGGIFWIRQGTQTRALGMMELSEMIYDRGLRNWELKPAFNATMEDIDLQKVTTFLGRRSASGNYVHVHGFITNGIYRQLTGVTDRTAHRDLETLVERGRLKGTGQRAARRYVLA